MGWWKHFFSKAPAHSPTPVNVSTARAGRPIESVLPANDGEPVPSIAEVLAARDQRPLQTREVSDVVEEQVAEARQRGDFDNLAGKGKPLKWLGEADDEDWLVNHVMEQGKVLPPWIELDQEIRKDLQWLRENPGHRDRAARIAAVNRRIDDFNLLAPSLSLQRPRWRD